MRKGAFFLMACVGLGLVACEQKKALNPMEERVQWYIDHDDELRKKYHECREVVEKPYDDPECQAVFTAKNKVYGEWRDLPPKKEE